MYTPDHIKKQIEDDRERLFASYAVGRSEGWSVDQQTKDIICISVWMREELIKLEIDELGRKTQEAEFNRYSRSEHNLFELAAVVMNNALSGNIDRNRKTHRRWG